MAEQITIEELGQRTKSQYPQYANMSDSEVGQAVLTRYPQYEAQVRTVADKAPKIAASEPKQEGFISSITSPFRQIGAQVGAALGGTVEAVKSLPGGISPEESAKIQETISRERFGKQAIGAETAQRLQSGESLGSQVGSDIGQILGTGLEAGSYLAPGAIGAARGAGLAAKAVPLARAGALGGALQAGGAQLTKEAQSPDPFTLGSAGRVLGQAGFGGGLGAVAGAALPALGAAGSAIGRRTVKPAAEAGGSFVRSIPERFVNELLRPPSKAFRFGKNPGRTVAELGITGNSEEEFLQNIISKRSEIGQQIGNIIESAPPSRTTSISDIIAPLDDAIQEASKLKRTNAPLVQRLNNLKDDLSEVIGNTDAITPQQAFELKQIVGDVTVWTGQAFDKQVNQASVKVYQNLKKAIENAVPDSTLRELNKQYGNLIEAVKALENRVAVKQRNQIIGLGSFGAAGLGGFVGGGPGAIAGLILRQVTGSTAFKTRVAARLSSILSKLDNESLEALEQAAPRIEQELANASEEEIKSFIEALPVFAKLLRVVGVSSTSPAQVETPSAGQSLQ